MSETPRRAGHAGLIFVAIAVGLDALAQSSSFPILPRLAEHLLGGDQAAAARWVGVLEVAWAIPQFLAAPLLGMLSDRFGRRPVIVLSVFGIAAELVIQALAPDVWWLLAGRVLCGFTCGAWGAAMAYVTDITPPEDRARNFGLLSSALYAGIVVGPALGGLLTAIDIRAPFWVAAGFALLNGIYGALVMPESMPPGERAPLRWRLANPWGALDLVLRRPVLTALAAAFLLAAIAFQGKDNMLVLYTAHRYAWTPAVFGMFVGVLALGSILVQTQGAGRVVAWLGERPAVVAGLALQTAGFAAIGLAPTGWLFCLANLPTVLGAITQPALQGLLTGQVGPDEQGRLQGALGSLSSLASVVAPIGFTQLFALTIAPGWAPAWSGATILVGAGLSLAALVLVAKPQRLAGR